MEKLQETLEQALVQNENEKLRWNSYRDEHKQLLKNITEFQKHLSVEVMVPIGTKALMPGVLYHTGECLVSHSPGIFSKCTVSQVKTLCDHRLKKAKEHLQQLELEHDMYQNKLDIPNLENAFAQSGNEQDIIEEYDEETEKKWREEHELKVKKQKQLEAEQRKQDQQHKVPEKNKNDDDILEMLERLEMMEELEKELDDMDVQDEEMFDKIISGEMKMPPEKKRISNVNTDDKIHPESIGLNPVKMVDQIYAETESVDKDGKIKSVNFESPASTEKKLQPGMFTTPEEPPYRAQTNSTTMFYNSYFHHYVNLLAETKYLQRSKKLEKFKEKLDELTELDNKKSKTADIQEMIEYLKMEIETLERPNVTSDSEEPKIKFVEERNSYHETSTPISVPPNTLHLTITHTPVSDTIEQKQFDVEDGVIRSPSDIYLRYPQCFNPQLDALPLKSILKKNKNPKEVQFEAETKPAAPLAVEKKKGKSSTSMYSNIIGDIVEHNHVADRPDDAEIAPKRISKFRANRSMS